MWRLDEVSIPEEQTSCEIWAKAFLEGLESGDEAPVVGIMS
jgi:hypothetical protein